ncbi:MAG: carbohydrate-binding protein, partial [Thermoproteota archaeon]|nr:carbohydrate-binding protein [Thermoproteota archaeon]
PDGEAWYMKMDNPAADPRFDPKLTLKKNSDGSWKVTSSKVRMNVFTSEGYKQNSIKTYNQKSMATQTYMQSPSDWKNMEITGYVKINSGASDLDLTWYGRGGKHTGDVPCEGTAYKGSLYKDGRTRVAKEQWHPGGYAFAPTQKPISSIEGKWIGFKSIQYNTEVNGQPAVKIENWVDELNNGSWKKIYGYTDSGGFGNEGGRCGGSSDQIISWGGPIVTFRWDGTSNIDIKNLSVREITPP